MGNVLGRNIKLFRESNNYNIHDIASYLQIDDSAYREYEKGIADVPFNHLEQMADLFGCEMVTLMQESATKNDMLTCAFKADYLKPSDMKVIATFKKIVMNYLKIQSIE